MTIKNLAQGFLLLLLPVVAMADMSGTEKLDHFVKQVNTFQAHFEQTVLDPDGNLVEQAQGEFQLARPGKFRWDYNDPYPQHIVADGQNVWFYDVDLEQVTVKAQNEALEDTPATLLSGQALPEDSYNIRNLTSNDGLTWVELTPKQSGSNFQSVMLAFNKDELQQMIMRDSFDQRTRLMFSQVKINPQFKKDTFKFSAPEGIDIVGEAQQ
ncbi:MAG: outer membrane lipoprotein chaperone LolA [Pseudomonadota bacterium]|uniref:outer membrane lipoprotein chaperone LolA n=1 Tax=Methylophaga TaxID=40222 RepID=UPI00175F407B|nr:MULTISPECIES: outer membrane lipoprotein chaperone LolA [Methylophaga]MEC9413118.1 outer membrane lipoprotein chaperone LolA [Pseudomonadota bacterium]HIC45229.1 outer membrane lipoprotein chaperone LolA [Methylophaga sp.]HIM38528.1 outer membrane lipoprotein chaperone LolA [Methylophaga aminisulfidivorans]